MSHTPFVKYVALGKGGRTTLDYLKVVVEVEPPNGGSPRDAELIFYPSFGDREEGICPELPGQGPFTEAEWLAFDVATAALAVLLRRAQAIPAEDLERLSAQEQTP